MPYLRFTTSVRLASLAISALLLTCPVRAADEPPKPAAEAKEYKAMPWHLIDLWWDLGKTEAFESYSLDVKIDGDIPPNVSLYIAPVGLGKLDAQDFYGGIQTRSDGNTRTDRSSATSAPGLLLSMWGERELAAIRPSDGGFLQSSGHEGDFVSVRRPYAGRAGRTLTAS